MELLIVIVGIILAILVVWFYLYPSSKYKRTIKAYFNFTERLGYRKSTTSQLLQQHC